MAYSRVTREERNHIHRWRQEGCGVREIAALLSRAASSISRELSRNTGLRGYRPKQAVGADLPATVLNLDGANGREHWIAFNNFYVISRYNRSALYSLAVFQLASEIAQARPDGALPLAP